MTNHDQIISHTNHTAKIREPKTASPCNPTPRFIHRVTGVVQIGAKSQIDVESDITTSELPLIDENTRFPVASLSKVFTAVAVLQSIERNEISLQTRLDELIPELTIKNDFRESPPILIEHLLSHSSGLPMEVAAEHTFDRCWPLEELPTIVAEVPLAYPTGQRCQYSNLGYNLLGLALERISSQSFEAFMTDRVFAPMMLDTAGYREDDQTVPRYFKSADGTIIQGPGYAANELPAGGLIISANDLSRFLQHMLPSNRERSCLSVEVRQQLTTPSPYRPLRGVRQQHGVPAMGFYVEQRHGGYKPGYLAYCHVFASSACFSLIACPLVPADKLWGMHLETVERCIDASSGEKYSRNGKMDLFGYTDSDCLDQLPNHQPDAEEIQRYVGKYAVVGYYDINFEVRGEALHIDYGAMGDLRPVAGSEFVAVRYLPGERIRFVWDPTGSEIIGVYISMTFYTRLHTENDIKQHETLMARRFGPPK